MPSVFAWCTKKKNLPRTLRVLVGRGVTSALLMPFVVSDLTRNDGVGGGDN